MTEAEIPKSVLLICRRQFKSGPFSLYLFGSRAAGSNTPTSDFDFFAKAEGTHPGLGESIRAEIENLETLFKVDFFIWDEISEDLKKVIQNSTILKVEE